MQAGGIIAGYPVHQLTGLFVRQTVSVGIMTTPATEFSSEFRSVNAFKILFLNGFEIEGGIGFVTSVAIHAGIIDFKLGTDRVRVYVIVNRMAVGAFESAMGSLAVLNGIDLQLCMHLHGHCLPRKGVGKLIPG